MNSSKNNVTKKLSSKSIDKSLDKSLNDQQKKILKKLTEQIQGLEGKQNLVNNGKTFVQFSLIVVNFFFEIFFELCF